MHKKTAGNNTKMYIVTLKKSGEYDILWCAYCIRFQAHFWRQL